MRKLISFLVVAAFVASSPTVVAAKEKKQKQSTEAEEMLPLALQAGTMPLSGAPGPI